MPPAEAQPTGEQIRAFYALVNPPQFGYIVKTFAREKILATAQPMGFTSVTNPLIPDGVTIVSNAFSRFIENGTLTANQFGFVLPADEAKREALDCAEIHHFYASGRYAGGDIYLYDSYLLEGENLAKDKQGKRTFRIYSARFIYGEDRLVERKYGILNDGMPMDNFKYQYIETAPIKEESEKEPVTEDDIWELAKRDGVEGFQTRVSNLPAETFDEWFDTLKTAVDDMERAIEEAPEEISVLEEEIAEREQETKDTTDLKTRIDTINQDTEDNKKQLENLRQLSSVLEKEKRRREDARKAVERGAVIYERAQVVRAIRMEQKTQTS